MPGQTTIYNAERCVGEAMTGAGREGEGSEGRRARGKDGRRGEGEEARKGRG